MFYRRSFQTAVHHVIKPRLRSFSSSCSSSSPPRPGIPKRPLITCCLLASGLTYSIMTVQHQNALAEQKLDLLHGITPEQEYAAAKAEQDNLDVVKAVRANPDYFEVEAYGHLNNDAKVQSLTAATLRGKGKIIVPPVLFYNKDRTEVVAAVHLGTDLCGHPGIVHGGMLATLLDEILACVAMPALPNNIGFTANLNIDYRKPVKANQWVILRGRLDRVEGRKAYVEAWIESTDGQTKFTEAKSLYVGPKVPPILAK